MKRRAGMEVEICLPERDDTYVVEFYASYTPAKTYGLPENCYPEDIEFELLSIFPDVELTDEELELVEEKCWEHYNDLTKEAWL